MGCRSKKIVAGVAAVLGVLAGAQAWGAADGSAIFSARCAYCHGQDGKGLPKFRAKGQPDFSAASWQKSASDAAISDGIRKGKGTLMPAYGGKIPDAEIQALVQRIRAFGK